MNILSLGLENYYAIITAQIIVLGLIIPNQNNRTFDVCASDLILYFEESKNYLMGKYFPVENP